MQSGQVSIWVTLGVAILGIAGVITGQLINAWREDRRWRRDQHREDVRWKRQLEQVQDQRSDNLYLAKRQEMITAMVTYAGLVRLWQETMWDIHERTDDEPLTPEMEAELRTVAKDAAGALAAVELAAVRKLRTLARDTYYNHASAAKELRTKTYSQRGNAFTSLHIRDDDLLSMMNLARQELYGDENDGDSKTDTTVLSP